MTRMRFFLNMPHLPFPANLPDLRDLQTLRLVFQFFMSVYIGSISLRSFAAAALASSLLTVFSTMDTASRITPDAIW